MGTELRFLCPLQNGLHARPATRLAIVAAEFPCEVALTNERSGAEANAKSVLALVAADVRKGDPCLLRTEGPGAEEALASLRGFVEDVLPSCDEPLSCEPSTAEVRLPRRLRDAGIRLHAGSIVCPGIGQGVVVFAGKRCLPADSCEDAEGAVASSTYAGREPSRSLRPVKETPPEAELEKVRSAVAGLQAALSERLAARPPEVEASILRAHLAIAGDVGLAEEIAGHVAAGRSAARAIASAAASFAARLKSTGSAYVRERAVDVEDIGVALLERVEPGRVRSDAIDLRRPSIVAAENLTPRQLLTLDRRFLAGLALERAGASSHAMILARSFGIPTLTGVPDVRARLTAGAEAIVDAHLGIVIPEVSEPVRRHYARERRRLARRSERLARSSAGSASTRDGRRLEVGANVATAEEVHPAFARGADGIGLFRTEMLFIDRDRPPSEEEQLAIYSRAARDAGGRQVLVRTFDVGGDKPVSYLGLPREANPFLGYRGVRVYREHRDLLRAQVRAVLRASAFGRLALLVPMISTLEEVRWVRGEVASVAEELRSRGVAHDPDLRVGAMIEVPSAAFLADELAREVDFLSLGTNDLLQYFLAVDRGSEKVAGLYRSRHPAFLRLLSGVVEAAHRHGRWVGVCGEMAREPENLPLLLGLGLDEISVAAPEIAGLKAEVARSSHADCRATLEAALACTGPDEVELLLERHRRRSAAEGLLDPELVLIECAAVTKEEAIEELVDALYAAGRTDRPSALEDAVWAREAAYSTGLGHGFAIPHCKSDATLVPSIAVAKLGTPLEWGSLDGEPVRCVILLAVRESEAEGAHMKVLATLARRLMHEEFRERMLAAGERETVLRCLAEELGIAAGSL